MVLCVGKFRITNEISVGLLLDKKERRKTIRSSLLRPLLQQLSSDGGREVRLLYERELWRKIPNDNLKTFLNDNSN